MLKNNGINIVSYYIIICWIITPLWQNYDFVRKSNAENMNYSMPLLPSYDLEKFESMQEDSSQTSYSNSNSNSKGKENCDVDGFLCCKCFYGLCECCCCCRYEINRKDNHSDGFLTAEKQKARSRFIPFSLYNDIYMLTHPGMY